MDVTEQEKQLCFKHRQREVNIAAWQLEGIEQDRSEQGVLFATLFFPFLPQTIAPLSFSFNEVLPLSC